MEAAKAESARPAKKLSRKERLHAEDMELCGRVGTEFGLGPIECVSRHLEVPSCLSVLGCLMLICSVVAGIPVGIILGLSSASSIAKLIVVAIFIGMFVLGWPLGAISAVNDVVDNRVALYAAGVAQLRRDEPEPIVLRWADIETVTIEITTDEGLSIPRGKRLTWSEIKSLTMEHASRDLMDVTTRIDVRAVRRNRLHYFDPTGVPNAIFFAHVLARAATRNGAQVDGYHGSWQ